VGRTTGRPHEGRRCVLQFSALTDPAIEPCRERDTLSQQSKEKLPQRRPHEQPFPALDHFREIVILQEATVKECERHLDIARRAVDQWETESSEQHATLITLKALLAEIETQLPGAESQRDERPFE
jgi:hypothetical protein